MWLRRGGRDAGGSAAARRRAPTGTLHTRVRAERGDATLTSAWGSQGQFQGPGMQGHQGMGQGGQVSHRFLSLSLPLALPDYLSPSFPSLFVFPCLRVSSAWGSEMSGWGSSLVASTWPNNNNQAWVRETDR